MKVAWQLFVWQIIQLSNNARMNCVLCAFTTVKLLSSHLVEEEIYDRNGLMCLWRPSSPTICHLPNGQPEKPVLWFSLRRRPENWGATGVKSWSLKAWEPGSPMSKGRRRWTSQLKKRERDFHPPCASLFCSGFQQSGWCPPAGVLYLVY